MVALPGKIYPIHLGPESTKLLSSAAVLCASGMVMTVHIYKHAAPQARLYTRLLYLCSFVVPLPFQYCALCDVNTKSCSYLAWLCNLVDATNTVHYFPCSISGFRALQQPKSLMKCIEMPAILSS